MKTCLKSWKRTNQAWKVKQKGYEEIVWWKVVYQALCKKEMHFILQLKLMNLYQGMPIEPPFVESHHQFKSST